MNELIMPHNAGVKRVLESMKEVLALYKNVTGNYRPLLDGERYLTDREVAVILKVSRRTLQEYRSDGVLPYILLGGKVLYRESDLERVWKMPIVQINIFFIPKIVSSEKTGAKLINLWLTYKNK